MVTANRETQLDRMISYECGTLCDTEAIKLFQELIDSGLVWKLQGHYGRTATHLVEAGICILKNKSSNRNLR